MQTSKAWQEILRKYNISQTTTEPHSPWQYLAERRIQDLKNLSKQLLDRGGADDALWYLALKYASHMWNKLADDSLNGKTPTEAAMGDTPDISDLLQFTFNEPVYYHTPNAPYPASGEELELLSVLPSRLGMK